MRFQAGASVGECLLRATLRDNFRQQSNGVVFFHRVSCCRLMHPEGRREYHICSIRYSQSATSQPSTPSSNPAIFTATPTILNTFLITLNECSEWDHVAIVSALARCHSPLKVCLHIPSCYESMVNVATGDHDPHAQSAPQRFQQPANPEDGTILGHTLFFSPQKCSGSRCETRIFYYKSEAISPLMRCAFFSESTTTLCKLKWKR
jgi:hypothetical protein